MVAIKASLVPGYLRTPDPRHKAYLIFGLDAGLVSERGEMLAKIIAGRENPPGEIVRFTDQDLEDQPDRLTNELTTIPMFGGRKIVRATPGRRINAQMLKPLIEPGAVEGVLIVEGGNLKPDEALRAMFEKSAHAVSLACYTDSAADLSALVREVLAACKQSIAPEAQQLLLSRLGADRTLSRNEIEKLALYAHGKTQIGLDDVEAIVGDAAEQVMEQALIAAASGDSKRAIIEYERALAAGESAQAVILAAQRYMHRLHRIRLALDQGRSFDDVIRSFKPQVHFKVQPALAAQSRQWSSARIVQALGDIATAAKAARLTHALEDPIGERMLLNIARHGGRGAPAAN